MTRGEDPLLPKPAGEISERRERHTDQEKRDEGYDAAPMIHPTPPAVTNADRITRVDEHGS
jgi:hypothetical protein